MDFGLIKRKYVHIFISMTNILKFNYKIELYELIMQSLVKCIIKSYNFMSVPLKLQYLMKLPIIAVYS